MKARGSVDERRRLGLALQNISKQYIEFLASEYGIDVEVTFGTTNRSYFQPKPIMRHYSWSDIENGKAFARDGGRIMLGSQSIARRMLNGWSEYKSLKRYTREGEDLLKAVWWLLIHEFAHALDHYRNGRKKGVSHGKTFVQIYLELQREFPQEDFVNGFNKLYGEDLAPSIKWRLTGYDADLW